MKGIQIDWVDVLPMVNTTDSFLATGQSRTRFMDDLRDFFPVYMEKCFLPRMLAKARNENRIRLFRRNSKSSALTFIPNFSIEDVPIEIEEQKKCAIEYLSDVASFSSLAAKLSGFGRNLFGLRLSPNITTIYSLDEFIRELHTTRDCKKELNLLRLFGAFIFNRGRFLWPLKPIDTEPLWAAHIANYGYPLGAWCMNKLPKCASAGFYILRATRWSSWSDLNDRDISNIREKYLHFYNKRYFNVALNSIVKEAIKNGNMLLYETVGEKISKFSNTGRMDGTFWFFEKMSLNSKPAGYWLQNARNYHTYEKDTGRQSLHDLSHNVSRWLDYLSYLDNRGRCPRSVADVERIQHIVLSRGPDLHGHLSYSDWLKRKGMSRSVRRKCFITLRGFLNWVIDSEGLDVFCPVRDIDIPSRPRKPRKSHRPALSTNQWLHIRDILMNRPPPYQEIVGKNTDGTIVRKNSPTLSTYALVRLELGIRDIQARYLDKKSVLSADGFVISGDKNTERTFLQVIPYFDDGLKRKVEECIEWQDKHNHKTARVWYGNNENSPYGKVTPLFRLIGYDPKPIYYRTASQYMIRVLLKYQKESGLEGNNQVVFHRDGSPVDMSKVDPDKIVYREVLSKFKSSFDLHSLRVTAATIWYEAGVPLELIQEFITGHATMTMLLHYVKIRNADAVLKAAFQKLMDQGDQIRAGLSENANQTLKAFQLSSRILRGKDKELDGSEILKNTSGAFWRFFHYGICPTGACPNGLDGRCGVCPLLISGPPFKAGIAVQFNMAVSQAMITGSELRNLRTKDTNREPVIQSQVQELTGWIGWLRYIEQLESDNSQGGQDKIVLYSQSQYSPQLIKTSPVIHELQRCVDIRHCPDVWTENTYYKARAFLMTIISKLPKDEDPYNIVKQLTPDEIIKHVATYFLRLIEAGKTFGEIEELFIDDNYDLTVEGISNVLDYPLGQVGEVDRRME